MNQLDEQQAVTDLQESRKKRLLKELQQVDPVLEYRIARNQELEVLRRAQLWNAILRRFIFLLTIAIALSAAWSILVIIGATHAAFD